MKCVRRGRTINLPLTCCFGLNVFPLPPISSFFYSSILPSLIGLDKIEYLQNHSSEDIYRLAYRLIEKYFSTDEEVDSTVDPAKSDGGGQFLFNSNSNPPEGGYHF